jgi:hypothetical protein
MGDFNPVDISDPIAVRINDGGSPHAILGRCTRNAVTGTINLREAGAYRDFAAVDLYERKELYGHPESLCEDPYFFKIVPLLYRTWMYHYYFGSEHTLAKSKGNDGIMNMVLEKQVIDAPVTAGRWSSAILYAPAAMISCVTADITSVIITAIFLWFMLAVSVLCNSPRFYTWVRPITIGPRIVYMIIVLVRMFSNASDGFYVILGGLGMLGCAIVDVVRGDLGELTGIRFICNYEVIKILPQRVFVCRRNGADRLEMFGPHGKVHEFVTGQGNWSHDMALIAEIRGLVVELRPMSRQDWSTAWAERADTSKPVFFMGLDIFKPGIRSIDRLQFEEMKQGKAGKEAELVALINSSESPFTKQPGPPGRQSMKPSMTMIASGD